MIQPEKFDLSAICFVKIIIGKLIILILHKYCCRAFYCLSFKLTSSNCAWKNRWKYFFSTEGERGGYGFLEEGRGDGLLEDTQIFHSFNLKRKEDTFCYSNIFFMHIAYVMVQDNWKASRCFSSHYFRDFTFKSTSHIKHEKYLNLFKLHMNCIQQLLLVILICWWLVLN